MNCLKFLIINAFFCPYELQIKKILPCNIIYYTSSIVQHICMRRSNILWQKCYLTRLFSGWSMFVYLFVCTRYIPIDLPPVMHTVVWIQNNHNKKKIIVKVNAKCISLNNTWLFCVSIHCNWWSIFACQGTC